ncbi:MAG: hypothetical protein IJ218_00755 [Alphaproteobacteria bacterium]|nr:hypothetical protein [Alphaproteobacteria bacterium]
MRLYHYAPKENTVMECGLLSISKGPRDLCAYAHRAGLENKDEIMAWLDKTFSGRSRAISCLTEPIKWQGNDAVLKAIVDRSALFSFELEKTQVQEAKNVKQVHKKSFAIAEIVKARSND